MGLEEKNPENFFIRMIYLYVSPNLKQRIEIDSNIMFFFLRIIIPLHKVSNLNRIPFITLILTVS